MNFYPDTLETMPLMYYKTLLCYRQVQQDTFKLSFYDNNDYGKPVNFIYIFITYMCIQFTIKANGPFVLKGRALFTGS